MKLDWPGCETDASGRVNGTGRLPEQPQARAGSRHGRLGCLVWGIFAVTVLAVGAGCFWFTADEGRKSAVVAQVRKLADGTPLAFLADSLEDISRNASGQGGQSAAGSGSSAAAEGVSGRMDGGSAGSGGEPAVSLTDATQGGEQIPSGTEEIPAQIPAQMPAQNQAKGPGGWPVIPDQHVQPAFIQDLASFVVSRYRPGARGGQLAVSVQALNEHYGVRMTGLSAAGEGSGARQALMRYAFTPQMIEGLYGMYADGFLLSLAQEAQKPRQGKPLTYPQLKELYRLLGGRCTALAAGLGAVGAVPGLSGRIRALDSLDEASAALNSQLLEARFDLDRLASSMDAPAKDLQDAQARVNEAGAHFAASLRTKREAEAALARDIMSRGASGMDEETALYLARWADRRLTAGEGGGESLAASAAVLRDLAARCEKASVDGPVSPQTESGQTPEGGR